MVRRKTGKKLDAEIAEVLGYEVSRTAAGNTRSATFTTRAAARKFQAANPGSHLQVVTLREATGRIARRGRRKF